MLSSVFRVALGISSVTCNVSILASTDSDIDDEQITEHLNSPPTDTNDSPDNHTSAEHTGE